MFLGSLVPLRSIRQSVFAKRFWGPTPYTPNVPINCRDFGMVCLGPVCSSVGAVRAGSSGRAYNLRGAIPVIAPLFTFIVKHYANDVPVTLATFPCSRARSEGFPRQRVIVCDTVILSSFLSVLSYCHHHHLCRHIVIHHHHLCHHIVIIIICVIILSYIIIIILSSS